jgi:hypothetical protein
LFFPPDTCYLHQTGCCILLSEYVKCQIRTHSS